MLSRRLEIEIASVRVGPGEPLVTGSVGVAVLTDETIDAAEMLALADRRMYEVKHSRSCRDDRDGPVQANGVGGTPEQVPPAD
jgi:GGDEF domain-containing protein